ncbi:alpha/beta fold hydrolase [Leptospira idonii]|uniref:Alpha/beta fold hydrolase n=1 Tax=Leptospira idonii TaxID=1193500 RepID=A0A4V3JYG2_9LEPT|nr:alpha/beta fold hydrolase [Leptospira idonii]TGN21146.1 alpha/beta fold hydrolase [Leptospira idonii]
MKLAYKFYEKQSEAAKHDFIILHGLFGSSKNWVTVSKVLSEFGNVYSLDLRNHGDSPHSEDHSIKLMSDDLGEFIADHKIVNPVVLGHSMGGLVTMHYDLHHPGNLRAILIQDVAPRHYPFIYDKEVASMSIPIEHAKSRNEIDSLMAKLLPDTFIRQFLQMSLERKQDGGYYWKLNLPVIAKSRKMFEDAFGTEQISETPGLFLIGGDSPYFTEQDEGLVSRMFPKAKKHFISGGGHYIHFTHANEFLQTLTDFIKEELV